MVMTIDEAIKAIEGSQAALRTLSHHHRAAAVYGLEALGLDDNGRLRFDRLKDSGDGVDAVAKAANNYLNGVLQSRLEHAASGSSVDVGRLSSDELARLQAGYFGISSQDVTRAVGQLEEDFTPEALVKMFEQQIELAKGQINQAPLSVVRTLNKDAVLDYVGFGTSSPRYGNIDTAKIEAPHMLALLSQHQREKAVPDSFLKQIGVYKG